MSLHCRGLSLIEVAIVIALISVLMVLSLPMLSRANARARTELCQQNLVEIGQTVVHYARDTNHLPTINNHADDQEDGMTLPQFIGPRVQSPNVLFCPSDETLASQEMGTSYQWGTSFNNQRPSDIAELIRQRMVYDREAYHADKNASSNEIRVTEGKKSYNLSLNTVDCDGVATSSTRFLNLTDKREQ